jgi:hypothetical protein
MKECLNNAAFLRAYEWLKREQKTRLNNNYYSKEDEQD